MLKLFICLLILFPVGINASLENEDIEKGLERKLSSRELDRNLVNIYQNVSGCEDDYIRCSICLFRFFGNTSETISKFMIIGTGVMTGIITIPNLVNDPTRITLGSISGILGITSVALLSFKKYSDRAIVDREEQLKHILRLHGIKIDD